MLALTPHAAWAHLVVHAAKDVENRGWVPGRALGQLLAIHAGANVGERPGARATREALQAAAEMGRRAGWRVVLTRHGYRLEATRDTYGWRGGLDPVVVLEPDAITTSAVVGVVRVYSSSRASSSPWAVPGLVHWGLASVRPLAEPLRCGGALGLWDLTPDQSAQVGRQLVQQTAAAGLAAGRTV